MTRTLQWLFLVSVLLFVSGIGFVIAAGRTVRAAPASAGIAATRKPSHAAAAATRSVSPTQMMPQRRSSSPIERSVSGGTWRRPR